MDWSLLGCGRYGHITFAPVEPELRARLHARLADGDAWRCLRCGTFVPGTPALSGPAGNAPVIPRGKEIRSKLILRLFALERFLRALVFAVAAFALWRYRYSRTSIEQAFDRDLPIVRDLFRQLGYNIDHSRLVGLLQHALTLSSGSLTLLTAGAAGYAAIEVVEGTGLWLARRWGEYFAMIATSLGLPVEVYDLTRKVTVAALVLLVINLALVLYLVTTKRLFGVRGGKRAYDARLRRESVLEAARLAADEAAERTGDEAAERTGDEAAEIAAGKPAEIAAGKPAEIAAGKPAEIAAGKPAEIAAGKPAEIAAGRRLADSAAARARSPRRPG